MRRRGCLTGIIGVLVALVLCCAIGWFVALPRLHDQVEDELARVLSTEVADTIDGQVPGAGVEAGTYRISMAEVQRRISGGSDNLQVEGMNVRGDGQDIVIAFEVTNASAEYRFTPAVSPEGYLDMSDMRGDGGIVEKLIGPDSIGNAIETSVNTYLQANGLYLQEVVVDGDDLVLTLGDR